MVPSILMAPKFGFMKAYFDSWFTRQCISSEIVLLKQSLELAHATQDRQVEFNL